MLGVQRTVNADMATEGVIYRGGGVAMLTRLTGVDWGGGLWRLMSDVAPAQFI